MLSHSVVSNSFRRHGARQAPLSTGILQQEYWSGLPCPTPVDLPNPGIKPRSPALQQIVYHLSHQGNPLLLLDMYILWFIEGKDVGRSLVGRRFPNCLNGFRRLLIQTGTAWEAPPLALVGFCFPSWIEIFQSLHGLLVSPFHKPLKKKKKKKTPWFHLPSRWLPNPCQTLCRFLIFLGTLYSLVGSIKWKLLM